MQKFWGQASTHRFIFKLTICLLALNFAVTQARACPALILARHLPTEFPAHTRRDQMALYRFVKADHSWRQIPMQLDPLDAEGSLLFPKANNWMEKELSPFDRMSFSPLDMGDKASTKMSPPCHAEKVIELQSETKYVYLMKCTDKAPQHMGPALVNLNEADRIVASDLYKYQYSSQNQMVFDFVELRRTDRKEFARVASHADLLITSDIKNFLTLTFDTDDIDARIINKRFGQIGIMGGLQFFLKILALRIDLALLPEVNFFADSVFSPMTMQIPVPTGRYLRRGSGIYYTWESHKQTEWLFDDSMIDDLDLESLTPKPHAAAVAPNPKYCKDKVCRFSLLGRVGGRLFSLNFAIARKAAALGFYPRLIRDLALVEAGVGRKLSRFGNGEARMGVYFEASKLTKGGHTWEFWIHFPEAIKEQCPKPLRTVKVYEKAT